MYVCFYIMLGVRDRYIGEMPATRERRPYAEKSQYWKRIYSSLAGGQVLESVG